jgi:hypothetical protein
VILSLPSTITANLTFSGPLTFTGSVGGTALSAYLAAPPPIGGTTPNAGSFSSLVDTALAGSGFRCVHADPLGTLGVAATDCGTGGGGGAVSSVSGSGNITATPTTGAVVVGSTGFSGGLTVASACTGTSCTPVTSCETYANGIMSSFAAGACSGGGGGAPITGGGGGVTGGGGTLTGG